MDVMGGEALYAVIKGRPIVWRVIGWDGAHPLMVPVAKFPKMVAIEVSVEVVSGDWWKPGYADRVMYCVRYGSAAVLAQDQNEVIG